MLATWAIHLLKLKEISGLNMSIFQKVAEKKTHLEHDMQLLNNNTLYKTLRFQHLAKKKKNNQGAWYEKKSKDAQHVLKPNTSNMGEPKTRPATWDTRSLFLKIPTSQDGFRPQNSKLIAYNQET